MTRGKRPRQALALALALSAALFTLVGSAAANHDRRALTTVTVDTLPIANGLPLDLGISKGFFSDHGIEIKKVTLQSGNDIVLALANSQGDIGYIGWVPAFIASTSGVGVTTAAASEVEGTNLADNWQNIVVKGSSSIRTPQDLVGKTIAVNALHGVGEVVIRGAFKKLGLDPSSVKLLAVPFPAMRTALANGQVDAIWTPEPFLSQAVNQDGARVVMAPGPTIMPYLPNGLYVARTAWAKDNPALAKQLRLALNQSLVYAQGHPDEIRALLPAATRNIKLPVWSPVLDRGKLLQLAKLAKEFGAITRLPDLTQLVPGTIASGVVLKADVGAATISLKLDRQSVKTLSPGTDTIAVSDRSARQNFHLKGPGIDRKTAARQAAKVTWTVVLRKGTYRYYSDTNPKLRGSFTVG
jgi:NitT/TauT family transport system substrate-binding protein